VARKPGWYDDPDGLPGVHRWWDGQTWTVDVTTDPKTAQPRERPTPDSAPDATRRAARGSRTEKTIRRTVYVVVSLIILVNGFGFFRSIVDLDLIPGTDATDVPDVDIPEFDLSEIPRGPGPDGRYAGGGLSYDAIEGRWTRTLLVSNVPMDDLDGEETIVARPAAGNRQYAFVWLGTVDPALVHADLETTASNFADRFAERGYPTGARLDHSDAAETRVDGAAAVRLIRHYDYRVRGTPITGEELVVLIIDTADLPAVWVASVPDGFPTVRDQADRALASLRIG
jgi:Protein of unknown function (DUF2510)